MLYIPAIGEIFCNAEIHGQLSNEGKPLEIHSTRASSTSPAVIACHIHLLAPDSRITYHTDLKILRTRGEVIEFERLRDWNERAKHG